MSNLKPKFGPKVCLAPPCQAFNLTLGQNTCFVSLLVKLETQIRAKGLSSPTMPSLQPYTVGQNACFAPPHVKLETQIRAKGLSSPLHWGKNACFALPHVKLETQFRAKGLSSPTMPSLQPYIGAKALVLRSRMSNLKPKFGPKVCLAPPCQAFNLTLGQKRLFCAPACQT